jgi:hypothetical protein
VNYFRAFDPAKPLDGNQVRCTGHDVSIPFGTLRNFLLKYPKRSAANKAAAIGRQLP